MLFSMKINIAQLYSLSFFLLAITKELENQLHFLFGMVGLIHPFKIKCDVESPHSDVF